MTEQECRNEQKQMEAIPCIKPSATGFVCSAGFDFMTDRYRLISGEDLFTWLYQTLAKRWKALRVFLCWLISDQVKGSNPVQDGGNLKAKDLGAELARIEMKATDEWWLLKIWGLIFWGSKHWLIQIDQNQLWDHGMNLRWLDSMASLYFRWSKIGETDLWLSTRVRSLKNSRDEYTLYLHRGGMCDADSGKSMGE